MGSVLPFAGGLIALVFLLFLGLPIFAAFLIVNTLGTLLIFGTSGFGLFANSIFSTATTTALATVPLFIVMGEILFRCGAMDVLFDALDRLIGRVRGRQFILCIILSAILGALSGAAMAVAGLLGRSLFPAMRQRGYDTRLAAGTILGGAALDPIIPPSILAVLISTIAGVSTASMLVAGIVPGILLVGLYLAYVMIRVYWDPTLAPDIAGEADGPRRGGALLAVVKVIPCSLVFFLVMGLIMAGVATPTEAAATGVAGAILVAAIYRGLTFRVVLDALHSAATISSLMLVIMCSAVMFGQLLSFTGATQAMGQVVVQLGLPGPLMLFALMALPFVLFMFLDQLAIMMVLIPIYQPLLSHYAFDPIWFWTLFLIVATVGGLTPPFGYVLFALKSAAPDLSISDIYSASWPFVWLIVLGLVVLAIFPGLVTFLPNMMAAR
jgi:tripartite ATP-independent transporter DctM subunit